jgi:glycosyltransferase involved in cell wall biosynthesis
MKIGVVIPSRLAERPGPCPLGGALWLEEALASIGRQTCFDQHQWVVVVGVDKGATPPVHDRAGGPFVVMPVEVSFVEADGSGQSVAVNAAARVALDSGAEVLAFLEDDDRWMPRKMAIQLASLDQAPFSSCSQRVFSETGLQLYDGQMPAVNDYPIPSGWVMRTDIWQQVGGLDETFRYLVDTEWLGRLNQIKVPRLHFVENRDTVMTWHFKFSSYADRHSQIVSTGLDLPLVIRTQNTLGGMATINRDPKASAIANEEQDLILRKYGENPW